MNDLSAIAYQTALEDFRQARRTAIISNILAGIKGRDNRLLSFEEVRRSLKLGTTSNKNYLAEIPLDSIIGSVNRYQDFTRDFLPKKNTSAERWAKVSAAFKQLEPIPPIEVFKIGEVYFVNDGNHRVSVSRQMGNKTIQAYVTEIKTRVPLLPDQKPEELIIKAEQIDFLEQTRLDILRPDSDFSATAPEAYCRLTEHIAIHHYFMNVDQQRDVLDEEAAINWYDTHFLPTTNLIQESGLLHEFPNKTPVDLYVWLIEHKTYLEGWLGKRIDLPEAAQDLISQHGTGFETVASRIKDAILPDALEGPLPGSSALFSHKRDHRDPDHIFSDILVPIDGKSERWFALEQAVIIAQKENAHLYGLHVTPNLESPEAAEMVNRFTAYCQMNGVEGILQLAQGETSRAIIQYAAWQDLITINLAYPPGTSPLSRLTHGFRMIMQRTPTPILVVPQAVSQVNHAMLAYDGSVGAREALYVATYIASKWGTRLSILTIHDKDTQQGSETAQEALDYIHAHNLDADVVIEDEPISAGIIKAAEDHGVDLIIMGGFSRSPVLGILLDSIADQVLRKSQIPILMCR